LNICQARNIFKPFITLIDLTYVPSGKKDLRIELLKNIPYVKGFDANKIEEYTRISNRYQ